MFGGRVWMGFSLVSFVFKVIAPDRILCSNKLYITTPSEFNYDVAKNSCVSQNMTLVNFMSWTESRLNSVLSTCPLSDKDAEYWVLSQAGTCSTCSSVVVSNHTWRKQCQPCSKRHLPLCEHADIGPMTKMTSLITSTRASTSATASVQTPEIATNRWIPLETQELYVSSDGLPYEEAVKFGHDNLTANLWQYTSITHYFKVSQQLGLNTNIYWIAGSDMSSENKCLMFNVSSSKINSLSVCSCNEPYYAIYSRLNNATDVLQQDYFQDILNEITIDTKKTGKVLRSRISASNRDSFAKALGGTVGMVFVLVTLAFILFIDLQRMAACCHCHATIVPVTHKTESTTTSRRSRHHSRSKL